MKKFVLMGSSLLLALVAMTSCYKDNYLKEPHPIKGDVFDKAVPTSYYKYTEMSVPAATDKVYIEYEYKDGSIKTIEQAVTPEVTVPTDGREVEPFGTVKLLLQSDKPAVVNIYYRVSETTKAGEEEPQYTNENLPLDGKTFGEFGKTRYVLFDWNFAYQNNEATNWQNAPTYPKDVVFYDEIHNTTLRYKFAYSGTGNGTAYFLDYFYEVENYVVTAVKNEYCSGCGNCPYCMPWGCSCGCGGTVGTVPVLEPNTDYEPTGDTTEEAENDPDAVVVDTTTPGETPMGDGGTVTVDENGTITVDYAPADVTSAFLPEPASRESSITDEEGNVIFTTYHSSGVVMFDDRFPALPDPDYLYDYNDLVVDYDIEALTVPDEYLEAEGWRERVKVTLHIRALGGNTNNNANNCAIGAGVILENFNTDYVEYAEEDFTLDSGGHGTLPTWTQTTLVENSIHYDPLPLERLSNKYRTQSNLRPAVEVGRLQALNSVDGKSTGGLNSGNEVYQSKGNDHVFNPARKKYAAWGGPHTEQYDPALEDLYNSLSKKLSDIQKMELYNTIPGYLNVDGGLYTYTVYYYMKNRADYEDPAVREAAKANMIDAVVNTNAQNFYLVKANRGAVGLKGYKPLDVPVKDFSKGYYAKYQEEVNNNPGIVEPGTYFQATNGMVWGFKCPVLTRHTWELIPFAVAYPHYKEWVESNGAVHSDWYKKDVNTTALVCEW